MFNLSGLLIDLMQIFKVLLLASVVMFWLVRYNVVDYRNAIVRNLGKFLSRVTEPVLAPIRRALPDMGGIDISAIIAIIAVQILQNLLAR